MNELMKNSNDAKVSIQTLISKNISISPVDLEIGYAVFLTPGTGMYWWKYVVEMWVYTSIFHQKNSTYPVLSSTGEIEVFLKISSTSYEFFIVHSRSNDKQTLFALKGSSEIFFLKKSCTILKNLFFPISLQEKWDQKAEWGSPKNEKCVIGSVGYWHQIAILLWPITSPLHKKRSEIG